MGNIFSILKYPSLETSVCLIQIQAESPLLVLWSGCISTQFGLRNKLDFLDYFIWVLSVTLAERKNIVVSGIG